MENIKYNRNCLLKDIKIAHENSFFKDRKVTKLVAVSKKQEDYKIDLALEQGQRIFGENRLQEAQKRWESRQKIYKDLELRLIGPLQTNKVKEALKLVDIRETIDREKLATQRSIADKNLAIARENQNKSDVKTESKSNKNKKK